MAIVTIQHRRGNYGDFDKQKMLPGEMAWVLAEDPNLPSGKAVYVAYSAGDVERLISVEQLEILVSQGEFKGDKGDPGEPGAKGDPGKNGTSVSGADIDETGHLIITLDDGTEYDAGYIDDALARLDEAKQAAADAEQAKTDAAASAKSAQESAATIGDSVERSETAASQAAESASAASASQTAAAESAETAEQAKTNAQTAAQEAEESKTAAAASATEASDSADTATQAATDATTAKNEAATSATAAQTAKTAAEKAETEAESWAKTAQSYANGESNSREGEESDNAKEYARQAAASAEKAAQIAGGDFVPNSEKGAPNGVAQLGEDGKVPLDQLPDIAPHTVSTPFTLKAAKWAGEEPPYTYNLNIEGLRADQHVDIYNAADLNNEEIRGFALSCITWKSQSDGQIVLKSLQKPAVDLPIILELEEGQEILPYSKVLAENTWDEILEAGETPGLSKKLWQQAAENKEMMPLDLGDEGIINFQIGGFNVDELADDSGTAEVTWIAKELLKDSKRMNPSLVTNYNEETKPAWVEADGGWKSNNQGNDSTTASAKWTITATDGGTVTVSYKVGSESYDKFTVKVNGLTIADKISGNQNWADHTEECEPGGTVTVDASYVKDANQGGNGDTAYVKFSGTGNISISPDIPNITVRTVRDYDEGTGTIGGWEKCELRPYVSGMKEKFPENIQKHLKIVKKTQPSYNTSGATETQTTFDDIWIPSFDDILRGGKYPTLFPDNASRSKKKVGAESASWWWLRSAANNNNNYFHYVNGSGNCSYSIAYDSGGVALGFCTGSKNPTPIGNCTDISATAGDGTVTIKWTDPVDSDDATWAGTKLVRKEGGYPESVEDGTELVDCTTRDQYKESGYEDSGLTNGTTYYYQLFPYTDKVVTVDAANRVEATPKGFADLTWEEIDAAVTDGSYKTRFKLHDTKDLVLGGDYAETIPVEVGGIDHDDLTDGGKAGLTFIAKVLLKDSQQMNSTSTNEGGWERSALRTLLNGAIFDAFPEELKPLVQSVKKVSDGGQANQQEVTTDDKVWIPSYHEVGFSGSEYAVGQQGTQYDIFTDNNSRRRSKKDASSSANWWLRSSYVNYSYYFWYVSYGGYSDYSSAANAYSVALGFCLGKSPS